MLNLKLMSVLSQLHVNSKHGRNSLRMYLVNGMDLGPISLVKGSPWNFLSQ